MKPRSKSQPRSALDSLVAAWRSAAEREEAARAERYALEEKLRSVLEPRWRERCRSEGQYVPSFSLPIDEAGLIVMVRPERSHRIAREREDELRAIFGDDYANHFEMLCRMWIDFAKLATRGTDFIVNALSGLFEYVCFESEIRPLPSYYRDRVLCSEFARKAETAEGRGLVKPLQPAFIVRPRNAGPGRRPPVKINHQLDEFQPSVNSPESRPHRGSRPRAAKPMQSAFAVKQQSPEHQDDPS